MGKASSPQLLDDLERLLGPRVHHRPEDLLVYECDGLTIYKTPPLAVTFPTTSWFKTGIGGAGASPIGLTVAARV